MNMNRRWTIAALCLALATAVNAQASKDVEATAPKLDAAGDPLPPGAILRLGSMRWRPGGSIEHLAFAPDGKRLASWHEEHYTTAALTIWDTATGRELRRVEMPGLRILHWSWLTDGRGVAVVQTSTGKHVWEYTDEKAPPHKPAAGGGTVVKEVGGPDIEDVVAFAVSPDGKLLAGGKSGTQANKERDIVLWDLATQRSVASLPKPKRLASCPDNCSALFFTPDSSKLVTFSRSAVVKGRIEEFLVAVFDAATGKEVRRFKTPAPTQQGARMSCALSSTCLALGLEDEQGTLLLWDLNNGPDRRLATGHGKTTAYSGFGVSAIAFTSDGKTLLSGGRDGALRIWDVAAGDKLLRTIEDAYPGWVEVLAVSADGVRVACGGQGGIIQHWHAKTGEELGAPGHGSHILSVGIAQGGKGAVTSCADNRLRVWDLDTGAEQRSIPVSKEARDWPHALVAPDKRTVLVNVKGALKAWDLADGREVPLPALLKELRAGLLRFAPDGKTLLTGREDAVAMLDWPSGKLRRQVKLPEPEKKPGQTRCDDFALSPDGRWLVTLAHRNWYREERGMRFGSADDGVLDLWNAATGERVQRLVEGPGSKARFTADGDLLFVGNGKLRSIDGAPDVFLKGEFHLLDPLTGRLKRSFEKAAQLPGSSYRYNAAIGISPDGRSICCAGNDGAIHIYETATGKIRRSLIRHRDYVSEMAFTADGRRLLTASLDLTALVWDISLAGHAPRSAAAPSADEQAKLWELLLSPESKAAYEAMATLAAHPKTALDLIRKGVKAADKSPDDRTLDRLVTELGDEAFMIRDRAAKELDRWGQEAVAGMRARLAKPLPLETRRRIVRFLIKYDTPEVDPVHLRELRSLEILEQLDGSDSMMLITALARGAPNARLTQAAAQVLERHKDR